MAAYQLMLLNEVVKKSNVIARAEWKPKSPWEAKIVALVASKVREDDEDFLTYKIPVNELTGLSDENLSGAQYQDISESIRHLGKAVIRIEGDKPRNFVQYNIFSKCGYENGYIIAGFHPDLKPHYLSLKSHFITYNLYEFLKLPSIYSQKMFELLKSWSGMTEITVPISELHRILQTPELYRKDFMQFRTRVLEKAHKDITKTSLQYEWEPIRVGKSVERVRFVFSTPRRALTRKELQDAKQEKQSRLNNQRFLRAAECLKEKGGNCSETTNKPIVCKVCKQSVQSLKIKGS